MWQKIDKKSLPITEILAANFKKGTYGYKEKCLGYLSIYQGEIICENEYEQLGGCTHFIDINNLNMED